MKALKLIAGKTAQSRIKKHGLSPDQVRMIVGASGGPKWLVLAALDRFLCHHLLPKVKGPLDFVGSSIGAWRMALYASPDPGALCDRFLAHYMTFRRAEDGSRANLTKKSYAILNDLFPENIVQSMLDNPNRNLNVIAVRGKGLAGSKMAPLEALGMLRAAVANRQSRQNLGHYFERIIFHSRPYVAQPEVWNDYGYQGVRLRPDTLADALMASGSIPFVSEPVKDIKGAGPGIYRDGGVTDYHFDRPWQYDDGIILYPHFYPHLVPGWFDKKYDDRRVKGAGWDQLLLVAPSPEFVATLPHGKITERQDFTDMEDDARMTYWQAVIDAGVALAEEFAELLDDQDKLVDSLTKAPS